MDPDIVEMDDPRNELCPVVLRHLPEFLQMLVLLELLVEHHSPTWPLLESWFLRGGH